MYEQQLQKIAKKIVKNYNPEKIILFGSYAWGNPKEDSDVDLFIIKNVRDTRKTARDIDRLIFPRPFPIDLIIYTPSQVERRIKKGDFFISDILTKGKILYAKEN